MPRYDFKRIETRWQEFWEQNSTFTAEAPSSGKDKLYVLDMFPYPSGSGLHVGHPEGYTATDIVCRYARMNGKNVLHPMGWDSFGLPAEEHAVKTGTHPRETTEKNIATFKRQLKMLGFSYDWSRELATTDPDYYRWTQWIFLQLFDTWYDREHQWTGPDGKQRIGKGRPIAELPIPDDVAAAGDEAVRRYQDKHRLAYISDAPVNWCPALGTVLANEEIIDGKSERGGHPVERLPLQQWMLRITAYADRLASELDDLDWPDSIKLLQRNWIGRSTGAEVDFYIGDASSFNPTPTARPDDAPNTEDLAVGVGLNEWRAARASSGFPKEPGDDVLRVYTTRPDTLYGATYMVIAPEHPFVDRLTTDSQRDAVKDYCRKATLKSDLDRTELAKDKTGVFTGSYATNPVNGERIPVWVADYVLISYGTGAIMAVPAHDDRDFEFARHFELPIRPVVTKYPGPVKDGKQQHVYVFVGSKMTAAFTSAGMAVNSESYTGLETNEAKMQITSDLYAAGLGKAAVNYKLRDWLFSRQRYWGEPFPIWHELDADGKPTGLMRTEDIADLPVLHPHMDDFKPAGTPEPMLAKAPQDWLFKTAADGTKLKRETNSMPQWAGSCWYFLRFCDNKNSDAFISPEAEKYWMPVDLYIGGAEHAVLHLLYSRFWHKVLFDRGHMSLPEPFQKLVNQGMILGESYSVRVRLSESGELTNQYVSLEKVVAEIRTAPMLEFGSVPVPLNEVSHDSGLHYWTSGGVTYQVGASIDKMSKSRGNVINPDDVVRDYGADSLRLYEMFMGPLEQVKPWSMKGVEGVYRFLGRVWRMIIDDRAEDVVLNSAVSDNDATEEQLRMLHKTIKAVTDDINRLSFNTAISRMMEFTNFMSAEDVRPKSVLNPFVLLLSPFAPHIAEELWHVLGHSDTLAYEPWPVYDAALLVEDTIEIPVQVKGKLKAKITVPNGLDAAALQAAAKADDAVQALLQGQTVVKVIAVPGRMVNFVVR
ncbi:MAG: leucine--tRNA ligase [Planctomycetaceae bacterium]